MFTADEVARFSAKVDKSGSCWIWTASVGNHGYGQMGACGTVMLAHRIAYVLAFGPIPRGLTIDHLCHEKRCVNPAHLEAVTLSENLRRAHLDGLMGYDSDFCPAGHPKDSRHQRATGSGTYYCVVCRSEWNRRYRMRRLRAATAVSSA